MFRYERPDVIKRVVDEPSERWLTAGCDKGREHYVKVECSMDPREMAKSYKRTRANGQVRPAKQIQAQALNPAPLRLIEGGTDQRFSDVFGIIIGNDAKQFFLAYRF